MDRPAPVRPKPIRPFTLRDGMILIAAIALVMGLSRLRPRGLAWWEVWQRPWLEDSMPIPMPILLGLILPLTPVVGSLTLAVLLMRLCQPRPRWRRVARQPGLAACFGLVVASAATAAFRAAIPWFPESYRSWDRYSLTCFVLSGLGGFAVLVSWTTLALARVGRPERSWLDRLGRGLGAVWIFLGFLAWYYTLWLS